jgi:N-acyl-D-amino-acid deacylase
MSRSLFVSLVFVLFVSAGTLGSEPAADRVSRGELPPECSGFDEEIRTFIAKHRVPGMAVAVSRQGHVVFSRGYGYADVAAGEAVQPTSRFRIASLSKPITAVAILTLWEQGKLQLGTPVFEVLDYEAAITAAAEAFEPRLRQVTIRQLLQHRGGWDRDASFDAMFQPIRFARKLGVDPPADPDTIIRAMLTQPLDFDPGERYAYSNFGYCLLGRVVEACSGQAYEAYVQDQVLAPLGIDRMEIGGTRLAGRLPQEVRYYHPGTGRSVFAEDLKEPVPHPYGSWYLEAMDAHGGWIAAAEDLARFAAAFDDPANCPILQPASIAAMHRRPPGLAGHDEAGDPQDVYYSLGWLNRVIGPDKINHWHTGSLPGTTALLIRRHDGLNLIACLNTRTSPASKDLGGEVDRLLHRAARRVSDWPAAEETDAR